MASAKMSLIALNRWMNNTNDDLFELLTLPEGIDKEVLTSNILLKGADFEVMYPDPSFMKEAIGLWSKKWYRTFDKWITALSIEYNPLENYDRMEDWTDTSNKGIKTTASRDSENTRTLNNQDKRSVDLTDVTQTDVSAYDSSSYQPSNKVTSDQDGTDTHDYSGTIKDEFEEGSSGSETQNGKDIHTGRIHGNVGVTTSQQMLEAELKLAEWNLYEHMTDLFLSEFVIPIYS